MLLRLHQGVSTSDALVNFSGTYSHSSDDRNRIWTGKIASSNEFYYPSFGFGESYTMLSTEKYYTSDYDLSKFTANQYGFGITYTDIFTSAHIWKFGLKSIDLKFNKYEQSYGLKAFIVAAGCKFVLD